MGILSRLKRKSKAILVAAAIAASIASFPAKAEGYTKPAQAAMQDLYQTTQKINKSSLSDDSARFLLKQKIVAFYETVESDYNKLMEDASSGKALASDAYHVLDGVDLMLKINSDWKTGSEEDKYVRVYQGEDLAKWRGDVKTLLKKLKAKKAKAPAVAQQAVKKAGPIKDKKGHVIRYGKKYKIKEMFVQKVNMQNRGMIRTVVIISLRNQIAKDLGVAPEMVHIKPNHYVMLSTDWDAASKGQPVLVQNIKYSVLPSQ